MSSTGASTQSTSSIAGRKLTPMLRQYQQAKDECPKGALLFFRMGDFYELFFDDAVIAAQELDLVLTSRDKSDDPVPMAGVPHHAVDQYLARLVAKGFTIAICDQVEDPRSATGLVKREITRLVTAGTISDPEMLDPGSRHYLAHAYLSQQIVTLTLLDLLAGETLCTHVPYNQLSEEIARMGVRELLLEQQNDTEQFLRKVVCERNVTVRVLEANKPTIQQAREMLIARFGIDAFVALDNGGSDIEYFSLARLLAYAENTQRRKLNHFIAPRSYRVADFLVLDEATRRNLELLQAGPNAETHGSLLWHIDRCKTAMGTRLLTQWLLFPLRDLNLIEQRYSDVEVLKSDRFLCQQLRQLLGSVRDTERLVGRVAVGRATPRDLLAIRETLDVVPQIRQLLTQQSSSLAEQWKNIDEVGDLCSHLQTAIVDDAPLAINDGGIFRRGYSKELDELINFHDGNHAYLMDIERCERERTGISSLKVRYNRVFGYYIEVTNANLNNVPSEYIRKQTLVNAERFITEELKNFEEKAIHASERRKACEQRLFTELLTKVNVAINRLRAIARLLAKTDVLISLGVLADEGRYVRPQIINEPIIELTESRHPVVERLLPQGERFIANDVNISNEDQQLLVITGPNMAGKSTVMRQTAICVLLAHMGSFVPAKQAVIGICDRIFTRVGAADHLGRGHSTFMVEMIEAATILRQATAKSFVLIDEIGRGTSTYDGVSIAWAVAEYLHDTIGCRTMFATHYHELTDLARERPRVVNMSISVKEHNEHIVFLRQLVDGAANRSYGIQVARLAGLPDSVLERARQVLANLESGELDEEGMPVLGHGANQQYDNHTHQLNLFSQANKSASEAHDEILNKKTMVSVIERELLDLDPTHMTPVEALVALDRLRRLVEPHENNMKE
ncbi:MAG: DNA mismatch repair protein MutS [Deltaproteobacteria bacterium]|nr:DNA mismatch repair protein MutS [Deltaproteobacteria bacterium]